MKLGQLRNESFLSALGSLADAKLPMTLAFKINQVREKIQEATFNAEKVRTAKALELSEKNEDGSPKIIKNETGADIYEISPEGLVQLSQEIAELNNTDVEIPKISFRLFPENVTLSANQIAALSPIIGE